MTRCCSVCGTKAPGNKRFPALGRFVILCGRCKAEFSARMTAPTDPSLLALDREAAAPAGWDHPGMIG